MISEKCLKMALLFSGKATCLESPENYERPLEENISTIRHTTNKHQINRNGKIRDDCQILLPSSAST